MTDKLKLEPGGGPRVRPPQERTEEIRQREAVATKGPWRAKRTEDGRCDGIAPTQHNHDGDDCYDYEREGYSTCPTTEEIVTTDSGYYGPRWEDAEFIAHAREDVPWLLAQLADLLGERDELQQKCTEAFDEAVRQEQQLIRLRAERATLQQWVNEQFCAYVTKARETTDPHERRYWEGWKGCLYNLRNKLRESRSPDGTGRAINEAIPPLNAEKHAPQLTPRQADVQARQVAARSVSPLTVSEGTADGSNPFDSLPIFATTSSECSGTAATLTQAQYPTNRVEQLERELAALRSRGQALVQLTNDDIDSIIEWIDQFIIAGAEDLESIWQPYIEKLRALKGSGA